VIEGKQTQSTLLNLSEFGALNLAGWGPTVLRGGETVATTEFKAFMDEKKNLIFEFSLMEKNFSAVFADHDYELRFPDNSQRPFLSTSTQTTSRDKEVRITGVLTQSPLILDFGTSFAIAYGSVFNLRPACVFKEVILETRSANVAIQALPDAKKVQREASQLGRPMVKVASFEVRPKVGDLTCDIVSESLSQVWKFFRFVNGADVAFGEWSAKDQQGNLAALQPDSLRGDPPLTSQNWSSFYCANELASMFQQYRNFSDTAEVGKVLDRGFELYRTATTARVFSGTPTGIILAQSLLELLSEYVLQTHAGWTEELLKSTRGFHNKLSASAAAIGYRGDLLEHAPDVCAAFIKQKCKPLNSYHLLTMARNDITHASKRVELEGLHLVKIWEASMFLAELHLFYLLDYRGEMADRRQLTNWFGQTIAVPLPRLE